MPSNQAPPPTTCARTLAIIPAMNEGLSIGPLIAQLRRVCPDIDVLVVDDGSTDDTVGQVPPGNFVVSLPFNVGIGGAMQTGYRYANQYGYDIAIQVDGDGQHRPLEIQKLIDKLNTEQADMVIGSRFTAENPSYRQAFSRWIASRMLNRLIFLLSGLRLTDCTSGFRAVNRRVIRAFAHWYPEDYPEPEVALLLAKSGYRIVETPVRMRQRAAGESSISMARGIYYLIKVAFCLLLDTCRSPWKKSATPSRSYARSRPARDHVDAPTTTPAIQEPIR